jgi:hypothetical protein
LRAVEHFEQILPIAQRLAAPDGRIVLLIGASQVGLAGSVLPDLKWIEPIAIPNSQSRVLVIGRR